MRPGNYVSDLLTVLIFKITFGFWVNPSGATIFDDLDRENFDRGELISMTGDF